MPTTEQNILMHPITDGTLDSNTNLYPQTRKENVKIPTLTLTESLGSVDDVYRVGDDYQYQKLYHYTTNNENPLTTGADIIILDLTAPRSANDNLLTRAFGVNYVPKTVYCKRMATYAGAYTIGDGIMFEVITDWAAICTDGKDRATYFENTYYNNSGRLYVLIDSSVPEQLILAYSDSHSQREVASFTASLTSLYDTSSSVNLLTLQSSGFALNSLPTWFDPNKPVYAYADFGTGYAGLYFLSIPNVRYVSGSTPGYTFYVLLTCFSTSLSSVTIHIYQ